MLKFEWRFIPKNLSLYNINVYTFNSPFVGAIGSVLDKGLNGFEGIFSFNGTSAQKDDFTSIVEAKFWVMNMIMETLNEVHV